MGEGRTAICRRPDARDCVHPRERHLTSAHNPYAPDRNWGCVGCWLDDGSPILGPYVHDYNPHTLTEAGWLPIEADA